MYEHTALTVQFLPVLLVGLENVLNQHLVLGESLPGNGHEFIQRQSVFPAHQMVLRILPYTPRPQSDGQRASEAYAHEQSLALIDHIHVHEAHRRKK